MPRKNTDQTPAEHVVKHPNMDGVFQSVPADKVGEWTEAGWLESSHDEARDAGVYIQAPDERLPVTTHAEGVTPSGNPSTGASHT